MIKNMIEKNIHQIWMQGRNEVPEKLRPNMKRIMDMHISDSSSVGGEWQYVFWDEEKIVALIKENEIWYSKYISFPYLHQKVDFAKLIILYRFGGIFIDMDAYTHRPLDSLFHKYSDKDFVVSKIKKISNIANYMTCGDSNFCINNGIYMGKSGADILRYLIVNMIEKPECGYYQHRVSCIIHTTGPLTFDSLIKKYIEDSSNHTKSRVAILSYDVMEPCIYDDCDITDDTYVVHKHENTWVGDVTQSVMRCYAKYTDMAHFFMVTIIILLFIILARRYK